MVHPVYAASLPDRTAARIVGGGSEYAVVLDESDRILLTFEEQWAFIPDENATQSVRPSPWARHLLPEAEPNHRFPRCGPGVSDAGLAAATDSCGAGVASRVEGSRIAIGYTTGYTQK